MRKIQILAMGLILINPGFASKALALAQFSGTPGQEVKGVRLSEAAKVDDSPGSPALKRVTQGLRQKKVVIAKVSVYVAQVFSNGTADFESLDKLRASLQKSEPFILSMTFVRDVGIEKIADAFKEAFDENKVDGAKAPFSDFVSAVTKSGDVKDKQTYFFIFKQDGGKESITFETNGKEWFSVKDAASGTQAQFLKLWLGKPVDSGVEQLQSQLLSKHVD